MSYFPIFIEMKDRPVLVVGAGSVASRRIGVLARFGAALTVVAPRASEEVKELSRAGSICLIEDVYENVREKIWQGSPFFMALAATGAAKTDAQVGADAAAFSAWFNMASDKRRSEFYFPAIAKSGELTAGLISGGTDPGLTHQVAKEVRRVLEASAKTEENTII